MKDVDIKKAIEMLGASKSKFTLLADGFIDEVWEIVDFRKSLTEVEVYKRMNQFADRITGSGSGGVGLEVISKRRTIGGFTSNTGFALGRMGADTTLIGLYGKDGLDPVFDDLGKLCRMESIDDASLTIIFEFDDGKVMLSDMQGIQHITWKSVVEKLGKAKVTELISKADIIGVGYWSLFPAFDEIVQEIYALMEKESRMGRFFFDFADFRKKDEESLLSTLKMLAKLNEKMKMTLSVNEHEAQMLFELYGESFDDEGQSLEEKTEVVRAKVGLDELVVHTPHYATAAISGAKTAFAHSLFCEKPVRTAGGGDTFNAGYMAAHAAGLDTFERLNLANAAVGYFLRNGIGPDIQQLEEYMLKT